MLIADEDVGESDGDEREVAANAFAAYLLAPTEDLRESVKASGGPPTPAGIVGLMRRYGLSYRAMAYRLRGTGLVTQKDLEHLLADGEGRIERLMRSQGFTEDAVFPAPTGVPELLAQGAMALFKAGVITEARLAELLDMTVEGLWLRSAMREWNDQKSLTWTRRRSGSCSGSGSPGPGHRRAFQGTWLRLLGRDGAHTPEQGETPRCSSRVVRAAGVHCQRDRGAGVARNARPPP